MPEQSDEFYIGYLPRAPEGLGKWLRRVVAGLIALTLLIAVLLVFAQQPFYGSIFEFGTVRAFEGVIQEKPYPVLWVLRPGEPGKLPEYSQYYLVNFGKFGAQEAVAGLDGHRVHLQGTLIYRDNQTMVEVAEGSIKPLGRDEEMPVPSGEGVSLGEFSLTGEIVDSKCFFGVMNPGNLKPHKSCAIRCISGGIPPVFLVRDTGGQAHYFLLVSRRGGQVNQDVLNLVAEPLRIPGEVIQYDNLLILKADPESYEIL